MRLRGYIFIFLAAFFWGTSGTVAKFLFEHDVPTLLVVESRVIISAVVLFLTLLVTDPASLTIRLRDIWDFILLGVIGVAGANYTYYMAINETSVGIAILMQYTAPVIVAGYMLVSKKEKISHSKTVAIVMSLIGCVIMLGALNPDVHITTAGAVLGALSAFSFAFFNIYNRVASKRYSVWAAICYTLMSASAFWLVVNMIIRPGFVISGAREVTTLALFSGASVLIPYFFYFTGLKYLVPSTAVIVSTLEPVVAILTAFILLGEKLHPMQIGGGLLIISSVLLLEIRHE